MEESFKLIKCPNNREAYTVCLTHTCRSTTPFICDLKNCKCGNLHYHCKIMKLEALKDKFKVKKKILSNSHIKKLSII
jgi:hypothetical protein